MDVYSIDVSANHNFFTDGFLVHNYTGYAKTAIYKQSDNTQVATSSEGTYTGFSGGGATWQTFTFTSPPNLAASTDYWLYAWGSLGTLQGLTLSYDSGGNGAYRSVTYGTWPDPLTGTTTDSYKYSIYVTYTAVAASTTNMRFGGVKIKGVKIK